MREADLRQPPTARHGGVRVRVGQHAFHPHWQPQDEEGLAVQTTTLRVSTPTALPLRYQGRQLPALPAQIGERQADLWLPCASLHADTVRLHAGFRPETLPAQGQLSTAYGTCANQYTALSDGSIQYVRRLELKRGRWLKTAYPGHLDFHRKVSTADKTQIMVLKTKS